MDMINAKELKEMVNNEILKLSEMHCNKIIEAQFEKENIEINAFIDNNYCMYLENYFKSNNISSEEIQFKIINLIEEKLRSYGFKTSKELTEDNLGLKVQF